MPASIYALKVLSQLLQVTTDILLQNSNLTNARVFCAGCVLVVSSNQFFLTGCVRPSANN